MGEKTLVESQITDSIALIEQLDSSEYLPSLAVWYYYDDVDEWRLIIAGQKFDEYLPKQEPKIYRVIAEAINEKELSSINISQVKIMKSDEPLAKTMKLLVGTDPKGITKTHFVDTTINAIFIKEMIVLRSA
jgi:hypothetical protein